MSSLWAATPREELLRLVPDSVGFCFVVSDLRGHAAGLRDSPFVEQLRRSPLAQKIRTSDYVKKLERLEAELKEKLGVDAAHLRDDILGDAVVMAYRPGPPGKPQQEQGALLVRARNDKVLADLIERINKVQKEEGELKEVEERRHKGVVYFRRLEHDKRGDCDKPPTFYYVHGAVVVLSSQESMIQEIIERDRAASPSPPTHAPQGGEGRGTGEAARRLRELDAERALLAVWINPRAFDAEVEAKTGQRSSTAQHFSRYWKALDSVVFTLSPEEREIKLMLGVRARVDEMPAAARRLFREAATASDVWKRFPQSALLAAGSRIDAATLLDVLGEFLTAQSRQALHALLNRQLGALLGEDDFARDVLPALGPDWGLCISAPAASAKSWIPQSLFALRISANQTKKPLDRKLLGAVDFAARLLIFAHNNEHPDAPLALKSGEVDGQEIRYLAGECVLPAGLQPAYGMIQGYLVVSSSVDGLTRFAQTPPAVPPGPGASIPLLRISIKDWKAYLKERREPIVQFLADHHKVNREAAEQRLDGLLAGLQFLERIELRQRIAPGRVHLTLSLQTAHALKK